MEENNEKVSIDTEELKNETVETAQKFKEAIKGTNIKEETKVTKGFVIEMFKNPIEKIKEVANDNSGKFFKTALFLIVIWIVTVFVESTYSTIHYWGFARVFKNILSVLKEILAPVIGIVVSALIVLVLNKNDKKSLITSITTITITKLPLIICSLISLLLIISTKISIVTIPFGKICSVLSIVLGYFGLKALFNEENDAIFIKKYVLIQSIYYIAYIVMNLLGIYI